MSIPVNTSRGRGIGLATIAASRRASVGSANRVKDGHSLSALRVSAGPPAGVQQRSSGLIGPDRGRRNVSLFDLPQSGQGLVNRLRAQVRPSSPLNGLGGSSSNGVSTLSSLSSSNSLRSNLRSSFARIDNGSRLLLSAANVSRSPGGFGLASITRSVLNLVG